MEIQNILGTSYIINNNTYMKLASTGMSIYNESSKQFYMDINDSSCYQSKLLNCDYDFPISKSKLISLIPLCDIITLRSDIMNNECFHLSGDFIFSSSSVKLSNAVVHSYIERKDIPFNFELDILDFKKADFIELFKGKTITKEENEYSLKLSISHYSIQQKIKNYDIKSENTNYL